MKILYINHYAGSANMGMEFRTYYLSREWVKMGHKVTIIAGDYSHLRQNNPEVDQDFQTEEIDGIEYVWLKTGKYEGNGVARALTMERFVRKIYVNAKKIVQKWMPDVVIASSTYPLDAYPAKKISRISKCKYVHEVHDMWPSTLYEIGGMSKYHPFVVLMQIAENFAYRNCDVCVALAPYTKEYMMEHGLRAEKFVNIQNGVVEEEWKNPKTLPEDYERFFKEHSSDFIVGYFGGLALSNSMENILETAKIMKAEKNIHFVIVGEGVEKQRLINLTKEWSLENISFLPAVEKRCVPRLVENFDISIMTGKSSPLYRFGLCMNKMYDSMMAGKPIVCAISARDTLVEEYKCGYRMNPENINDIVDAILKIRNMTEQERKEMGERGKKAVLDNFTYKKLAQRFIESIESIT